jgi:putative SOS response-associated peptidase YedK
LGAVPGRKSPKGEEVLSCTVLTYPANKILPESEWPKWLAEESTAEEELLSMLKPCADEMLKVWPVGKQVSNVKSTGPELLMPV